jgi:outer membrane protein TolC
MERNFGSMKVSAGSFILLFAFLGEFAYAQQAPSTFSFPPSLFGSVSQGTPSAGTIQLSIGDAIDRALKYNLGSLIADQETRVSAAARIRALSRLLPKVDAGISQTVQQIDLAAFGFSSFPGVNQVVGPFNVFDARARFTETVLDFKRFHELKAASERITASNLAQQDARDLIVLITTGLYLDAVAGTSRVDAALAQLATAQAVYDRAMDLKASGVAPGIDVVRAQVQLQAQQQRVVAAENDRAKKKLTVARAIGLSQGQDFVQTNGFITSPVALPAFQESLELALTTRSDYRRAASLIREAEENHKAALARRMPSIQVDGNYGDIGTALTHSHGTMFVQGTLSIPIYAGERTHAEIMESDALLEERKAEAANLRDQIEYEVRASNLDIQAAAEQVRVAQAARDLAQQQLVQAQDRFAAGVANGLEVTQAQEAIATADENYISSVYSLNISEAAMGRAKGSAERTIKSFFGAK